MDEKTKQEIIQLLKEKLTVDISIRNGGDYYSRWREVEISISLDGEEICNSSANISIDHSGTI